MGADLSIKNNKHEVTVDIQNNNSILAFRVKDRKNKNTNEFLHYKRYKYFQLHPLIKEKFPNIRQFHMFLNLNQDKITLTDTQVIIDLDGKMANIPFQNKNQESMLFCQMQNEQIQTKRKEILNSPQIKNGGLNIVLNLNNDKTVNKNNQNTPNLNNYENQTQSLREIVKKINAKNNPNNLRNLQQQNLTSLIEILQEQFTQWEQKDFHIPNMSKKKTKDFDKQVEQQKKKVQQLKKELQSKSEKVIELNAQIKVYKQMATSPDKIIENYRKYQQQIRKKVTDQFLNQVSDHLIKSNRDSVILSAIHKSKESLMKQIDGMVDELQNSKKVICNLQDQIKKYQFEAKRPQKLLQTKNDVFSSGMSVFEKLSVNLKDQKKPPISKLQEQSRF